MPRGNPMLRRACAGVARCTTDLDGSGHNGHRHHNHDRRADHDDGSGDDDNYSTMTHFVAFTHGEETGARVAFHTVPVLRNGEYAQPPVIP